MNKIKKGDKVLVISGKEKGKTGVIKKISDDRVVIDGLNLCKKHVKPNPQLGIPGGIIETENSIHVSNVALIDENTGKRVKVKFQNESGKKIRILKPVA